MSKEELYAKETKEMMKILNENCKRAKERTLKEQRDKKIEDEKKQKKENRKNIIQVILLSIFAIAMLITLVNGLSKMNKEEMDKCTSAGYSETWCNKQIWG